MNKDVPTIILVRVFYLLLTKIEFVMVSLNKDQLISK